MDTTSIVTLISNVGFPIVACGAMFFMMNKQNERHESEMNKMRESLDNNTKAINMLAEKLKDE